MWFLNFALGFIAGFVVGVGAFFAWLRRIADRIEEAERRARIDSLTGNSHQNQQITNHDP